MTHSGLLHPRYDRMFLFVIKLCIFFAPFNVYRLPITSGITLSITKFFLVIALLMVAYACAVKRSLFFVNTALYSARREVGFFIFLFIVLFIMLLNSLQPSYGIKILFLASTVFILYLAIVSSNLILSLQAMFKTIFLSTLVVSGFSIYQIFSFYYFSEIPLAPLIEYLPLPHDESNLQRAHMWYLPGVVPRIVSVMTEPNSLGCFLAISSVMAIAVLLDNRQFGFSRKTRMLAKWTFLLSIVPLIMSFSRSGWLTLLCGLIVLSPLMKLKNVITAASFILISVLVLFVQLGNVSFILDLSESLLKRVSVADAAGHINVRLDALKIWQESPIFGVGFGSYGVITDGPKGVSSTHSYFVTYLVEGGLLGFFAFLSFIFIFPIKYFLVTRFRIIKSPFFLLGLSLTLMIIVNNILYHNFWMEFTWVFYAVETILLLRFRNLTRG